MKNIMNISLFCTLMLLSNAVIPDNIESKERTDELSYSLNNATTDTTSIKSLGIKAFYSF